MHKMTSGSFANFALLTIATLLLLGTGCAPRLSFEKQYTLRPGEIQPLPLAPIGNEQTIKVSASAADNEFSCHIYLEADETEAENSIATGNESTVILASEPSAKKVNLEAVIPANQAAVVRLASVGGKAVTITVKMTN